MAIADDFSVAVNGDIRHVSGSTTYTVLAFHRYLQGLADDAAAAGNDLCDITSDSPSTRAADTIITLNSPFNIDDDAAEYLYDGSITQASGDTIYSGLVVYGQTAGTTTLQVVQNKALYDGDSPFWGTGLNASATDNILMRCLIKTRTGGADVDGKRIRVYAREWGHTYAECPVQMGLGNSAAVIFTTADLNNTTAVGTVATWTTITNTDEGYQTIDLSNGNGAQPYYSEWDRDSYTINQFYERCKWLTRRGSASTVYGMDGELFRGITHQWDYDGESGGPFTENEELTWGSGATAGSAVLLALLDSGTTGTMWVQLTSGVICTDDLTVTGGSSAATCVVNGSATVRPVSPVFIGASTGSALIGAFGVGVQAADLTEDDQLIDLLNVQQDPPNMVTFTVSSVVSGEDRVLVGPASGGALNKAQLALQTTLNGASETAVVVSTSIPADTPASGTIRIELDTGVYRRVAYTSWASDTFTIGSTNFEDPNDATAGNDIFVSYIDATASGTTIAFTTKYNADRDLYVRVRDGGGTPIKPFETVAVLGAADSSIAAVRTSDA